MKNNAIYWALARENAPEVFARDAMPPEIRALSDTIDTNANLITTKAGRCAIISIAGPLGRDTWINSSTGYIYQLGFDLVRLALDAAISDPLVSSILLSIDSPGGVVQGTKELADYISEAAKIKPMAAYANGLCASAAFWLAAATGRIYAPATALVGSIGIIMRVENWTGFYTRAGVQIEYITSGQYKAAGQDAKELTEDERRYFEGQLAELHGIFREDVRAALKLEAEDSLWAEAQLMPATQALPLGLVTKIVRDENEAVSLLANRMEEHMSEYTYEALEKNAPELLAEIKDKAVSEANSSTMACVRLVCGEEAAQACEKMLVKASELKLTVSQISGMEEFFPKRQEAAAKPGDRLEAIISAHEKPLAQDIPAAPRSALVADAEARASQRSLK